MAVVEEEMGGGLTLHGFILHGGDVFKPWRRDIPVLLHLVLLLLPVWGTAVWRMRAHMKRRMTEWTCM